MANTLSAVLRDLKDAGKTFYVYILHRADGSPFYVGKGTGLRIAQHGRCSEKESTTHKARLIRKLVREGEAIGYTIAATFDNERDAFAAERALISAIGRADRGRGPLANHTDGGEGSTNPSEETIAKRVVGLKAAMADPARKAAALARLHSEESRTKAAAKIKQKSNTPAAKADRARITKALWNDQSFRAKTTVASKRAQGTEWKAKQLDGIARVQADQSFHDRRNAGRRRPEVVARCQAIASNPERRAKQSISAKIQRADSLEVRRRVIALADRIGASVNWPAAAASKRAWLEIEARLLAGERLIDADPTGSRERQAAAARSAAAKRSLRVSEETRAKMSASAKARCVRDGTSRLRHAGIIGASVRWGSP